MMTKKKTTRKFTLVYLLFVPLVCGLLLAFSSPSVKTDKVIESLVPSDADNITIVVDAGHGGQDAGTYSNGVNEKDLALAIAKGIKRAGRKEGVRVILTRTADEALSLEERVSIVNRHQADMFLSVHVNKDEMNPAASGIDFLVSENNKQFDESTRLAEELRNELATLRGININGVKNSDSYVLSKNAIPAILIEVGYLSNNDDHAYISNSKNQKLISKGIIKAVRGSVK